MSTPSGALSIGAIEDHEAEFAAGDGTDDVSAWGVVSLAQGAGSPKSKPTERLVAFETLRMTALEITDVDALLERGVFVL